MSGSIHVAILGARGYGAGELLRLLAAHPHARVVSATSESAAGERIDAVHPHLLGFFDGELSERVNFDAWLAAQHAVAIAALPHGRSGDAIAELTQEVQRRGASDRARVIDLSGDFRLRDVDAHARHYPESDLHAALRERFVYGLPELNRERIRTARFVANPGCMATAAILATTPLIGLGVEGAVAIDAKTGSSGSGRQLKETTHHPTRHADVRAYRPLQHAHEAEIAQAWQDAAGACPASSFVAQSLDLARGIFVTAHATLARDTDAAVLRDAYADCYRDSAFVRLRDESPALQNVVGSNFCDVSVAVRGRQAIAMAALDNLVKGMAGTAIQNLNLMCGLDERCGLWTPAFRPV